MKNSKRIYVDNAATSWPKPPQMVAAMSNFYSNIGSSAGRGNGISSIAAKELIEQTRAKVAELINVDDSKSIVFGTSGTNVLNQAILGLLEPKDHVVTTLAEHNSVLRPLRHLEEKGQITVTRVAVDANGKVDSKDIKSAICDQTSLIVVTHASNVTGALQPIDEIGEIAKQHEIVLLIDAAQTLGHIRMDVKQIGCQLMAAPGHKGLLGPLGTGVLFVDEEIVERITPLQFGGTGTFSESDWQPEELPGRFESGNLNVAAITGLNSSIEFLNSPEGIERQSGLAKSNTKLWEELRKIEGITVYGPQDPEQRIGVMSFNVDGVDCRDVSAMLEANYAIETRAGLHCSPLIHSVLQTESVGGTTRISPGLFNNEDEMNTLVDAIKEIAAANIF